MRHDPQQLIDALFDGVATAGEIEALGRWIAAEPSHADAFTRQSLLHGHARSLLLTRGMRTAGAVPDESRTLASDGAADRHGVGRNLRPAAYALAAAVLLAGVSVAIFVFTLSGSPGTDGRPAPQPGVSGDPIATILESTGTLLVRDAVVAPGAEFAAGDVSLNRGEAEFRLANGVQARLTGAVDLTVRDPMHFDLRRGSVTIDCPPGVTGFTVQMPGGVRVTDLGTRFTAVVGEEGEARVDVLEGRVAVTTAREEWPVRAGMTALVRDGRVTVVASLDQPVARYTFAEPAALPGLTDDGLAPEGLPHPGGGVTAGVLRLAEGREVFVPLETGPGSALEAAGLVTASGDVGADGATLWISWLARQPLASGGGFAGVSLFLDGENAFESSYTFFGVNGGGAHRRTVVMPGTVGAAALGARDQHALASLRNGSSPDDVRLWVVRIDFAADPSASDTVSVWIDPDQATLDLPEPLAPLSTVNVGDLRFDRLRLISRYGADAPQEFDDLRLGLTWAAVVRPLPAASGSGGDVRTPALPNAIPTPSEK